MKKEFTVKEFVKEYNKDQKSSASKIKYQKYIPVADKIAHAENIVKNTFMKDEKFQSNSVARYILFGLYVVNLYTNIEVDFNDVLGEYDLLSENGTLNMIISNKDISEDVKKFHLFIKMLEEDWMKNRCEIHSFIESMVEKTNEATAPLVPILMDFLQQTPKLEK